MLPWVSTAVFVLPVCQRPLPHSRGQGGQKCVSFSAAWHFILNCPSPVVWGNGSGWEPQGLRVWDHSSPPLILLGESNLWQGAVRLLKSCAASSNPAVAAPPEGCKKQLTVVVGTAATPANKLWSLLSAFVHHPHSLGSLQPVWQTLHSPRCQGEEMSSSDNKQVVRKDRSIPITLSCHKHFYFNKGFLLSSC